MKKMIAIFIILLSCLFLVIFINSCTGDIGLGWHDVLISRNFDNVDFVTEVPIEGVSISPKRALAIANAELLSFLPRRWLAETAFYIHDVEERGFYVVTRFEPDVLSGVWWNVAICKTNGEIIKIWDS